MLYTRKFKFNYKPIEYLETIEVVGSVPSVQQYDADFREWTPDYSLKIDSSPVSPLILQPHIIAHDVDGCTTTEVNSAIASTMSWSEIYKKSDGTFEEKTISSGSDYTILLSGENAGRLTVMKNVNYNSSLTLRFKAYHVDSKTQQTHDIQIDYPVTCFVTATAAPSIVADCDTTFVWNPLRENNNRIITLKLVRGDREITDVVFHWLRKRSDGTWTEFGSTGYEYLDLGYAIYGETTDSTADNILYQDMSLMGEKLEIRAWAEYGNVTTLDSGTPYIDFCIVRRLPSYEYSFNGVPDNIEPGTDYIYPKLVVRDPIGPLSDPLAEFTCTWYSAIAASSGSQDYEAIATGKEPVISTTKMFSGAMILGIDVQDRGAKKVVTQTVEGETCVLVEDGKVVIDR